MSTQTPWMVTGITGAVNYCLVVAVRGEDGEEEDGEDCHLWSPSTADQCVCQTHSVAATHTVAFK